MIVVHKSEKYGDYYGELVEFDYTTSMNILDWSSRDTAIFCTLLVNFGVSEILFDMESKKDYTCTVYIETTEKTDYKSLMMLIFSKHPSEFSEETTNHFRLWFE